MKLSNMSSVTRRHAIGVVASMLVALCFAPGVRAHEGHDHKVLGTVTMAAADRVTIKTRDAKEVTVLVTTATRVLRDKQPIKAEEIPVGTRVVVAAVMDKTVLKAKTIQVAKASPVPAA
jgi:hypothetical protein